MCKTALCGVMTITNIYGLCILSVNRHTGRAFSEMFFVRQQNTFHTSSGRTIPQRFHNTFQ